MSKVKDISDLGRLVAARHGWPAAKAFKAYRMDDADRATLVSTALDILKAVPDVPNAQAMLSGALAVQLERSLAAPIHVIAGTLSIEGAPLWDGRGADVSLFQYSDSQSWPGHVWVMVGPYIVDLSLFRAAYSRSGPPALSRHVDLMFGPDKAFYVDQWLHTKKMGLRYDPLHVLDEAETTLLMAGAYKVIQAQTGKS